MQKVYLSVPSACISQVFIDNHYQDVKNKFINIGYDVIDNIGIFIPQNVQYFNIFRLSENVKLISQCNLIYFFSNWEHDPLCKLEHEIACQFFMLCYYECGFDLVPVVNNHRLKKEI